VQSFKVRFDVKVIVNTEIKEGMRVFIKKLILFKEYDYSK